MSLHGRAIRRVTDGFVGVDAAYREEVRDTASELAAGSGWRGRAAEVASLAGLALHLRWRHRTAGRADLTWRQGLFFGALLLLALGSARGWARAAEAESTWTALLAASGLTLALAAVARVRVRRLPWVVAVAVPPVAAYPVALSAGAEPTSTATAFAVTLCVPALLLCVGRFDPRCAAAALVLWFARLAVGDLGGLARAFAAPDQDRVVLLARWCLMASGVAVAWLVTHRSIRRLNHI